MKNNSNLVSQLAYKALTGVWGTAFLPSAVRSGFKGKKTVVPDDFTPVLRFAVCSDIHLNGEEGQTAAVRFGQLFDDMYESYAQKPIQDLRFHPNALSPLKPAIV